MNDLDTAHLAPVTIYGDGEHNPPSRIRGRAHPPNFRFQRSSTENSAVWGTNMSWTRTPPRSKSYTVQADRTGLAAFA